ncbi:MAG: DUF4407 domain-containing protein [Bacteroidia bacterium]
MINNDYPLNDKVSWITEFLWWSAGADKYFLMKSPKADRVKYAGIGGIVFCTGLLAMVSGGFAFHTIFGPKGEAIDISALTTTADILGSIIFGFVWGTIIFNLDRFIVSSTGKGDGTDKVTWKEVKQALPRIIIAIILGFAISAPLEIKILESEINAELQAFQNENTLELNKKTEKEFIQKRKDIEARKSEFEKKIAEYDKEVVRIQTELDALIDAQQAEMQDKRAYGFGPVAKKMQKDIDNKRQDIKDYEAKRKNEVLDWKGQIAFQDSLIRNLQAEKNDRLKENEVVSAGYSGLLKRIQISHEIGGLIPWVILFVFLSIETGPIFFKMMMNKGVYDYLVENYNYQREVENGIWKEPHAYEGKDGLIFLEKVTFLEVNQAKEEKKLKTNAQSKISAKAIEKWENKKLKEVESSPDSFITEGEDSAQSNNA